MDHATYLIRHRDRICQLLTQHCADLPPTLSADSIRARIVGIIAKLAGSVPADPADICRELFHILGTVAEQHRELHLAPGQRTTPFLRAISGYRPTMIRLHLI